jgi:hypothetical protein
MKQFPGWAVAAVLVVAASAANAQMVAPSEVGKAHYQATSDVQGSRSYAGAPRQAPETRYDAALLPPQEVYTVLRKNGFLPLGIPHPRGYVYMISVADRLGADGQLIIDGRNGQIIRFTPTFRTGGYYGEDYRSPYPDSGPYGATDTDDAAGPESYGAVAPGASPAGPLPPTATVRGARRPPGSVPRVASRTPVPPPKPAELATKSAPKPKVAAKPAAMPIPQSAAVQARPADTPAAPTTPSAVPIVVEAEPAPKPEAAVKPAPELTQQSAAAQAKLADTPAAPTPPAAVPIVVETKPAPTIQPTQEMPEVQGLE